MKIPLRLRRQFTIIIKRENIILKLLKQICEVLGEKRFVYVCRELTKKFEETLEGTSQEILEALGDRPVKGEIVVIVMPNI